MQGESYFAKCIIFFTRTPKSDETVEIIKFVNQRQSVKPRVCWWQKFTFELLTEFKMSQYHLNKPVQKDPFHAFKTSGNIFPRNAIPLLQTRLLISRGRFGCLLSLRASAVHCLTF